MPAGEPTISIVTPSLNQGRFLDAAMRSVLDQAYPALEYVVVDGGSDDGSVEIIRRHADRLAWWVSEPDAGQYDAIDKGFAHTGGEIMAWLNSDDLYFPWTFSVVAEIFAAYPEVEWLTSLYPAWADGAGRMVHCSFPHTFSRRGFLRGEHLGEPGRFHKNYIQQESTFWRRSLWERAGGRLDTSLRMAGDFELWARFYREADLYPVATLLAAFRDNPEQRTATGMDVYLAEGKEVLRRHGGRPWGRLGSQWRRLIERLPIRVSAGLGLVELPRVVVYRVRRRGWEIWNTRPGGDAVPEAR